MIHLQKDGRSDRQIKRIDGVRLEYGRPEAVLQFISKRAKEIAQFFAKRARGSATSHLEAGILRKQCRSARDAFRDGRMRLKLRLQGPPTGRKRHLKGIGNFSQISERIFIGGCLRGGGSLTFPASAASPAFAIYLAAAGVWNRTQFGLASIARSC
jgi:hypothetical protein